MIKNVKFSVLITNFNYSKYLEAAVQSVLEQEFKSFEVIIVDDGSTDESRKYLRSINDSRVQVILKENGGQASAFNTGWAKARGEYIAFLDSDDVWARNKLKIIHELLLTKNIAVIQHQMSIIDSAGDDVKRAPVGSWIPSGLFDMEKFVRMTHSPPTLTATSAIILSRKAADTVFPISKSFRISADVPLVTKPITTGPYFYLKQVLGEYRIHGNNNFAIADVAKNDTKVRIRRLTRRLKFSIRTHREMRKTLGGASISFRKSFVGVKYQLCKLLPVKLALIVGRLEAYVRRRICYRMSQLN